MRSSFLLLLAFAAVAQEPPPATFHAETRLVEVEVVVRHPHIRPPGVGSFFKELLDSGPPFGPPGEPVESLTKEDFTLFDQGVPQSIALFRVGVSGAAASGSKPVTLPPGAISNRTDTRGETLNGATVVFVDLLNTRWDLTEYARVGLVELLRSLRESDGRIALYSSGLRLHVLHDFTDDPQHLADIATALHRPHGRLPSDVHASLMDFGDVLYLSSPEAAAERNGQFTIKAMKRIIEHLSGIPGRKNLIWLAQIEHLPPTLSAMLQRANIALYPVMVRCSVPPGAPCGFARDESESSAHGGRGFGGRGFYDARDLAFAIQAAQEDRTSAYVLGYYPTEEMLDGRYHRITVSLNQSRAETKGFEIHYRSGYLATRVAVTPPPPTLSELIGDSLNSARIGLTAKVTPDPKQPGLFDVRVTVDLHDIHLDHKDGHATGTLALSVPNPSDKSSVRTGLIPVELTDRQLAGALENGFTAIVTGVESDQGEIRIVVRDGAGGTAGSLSIRVDDTLGRDHEQIP